jgi:hypothetical protein
MRLSLREHVGEIAGDKNKFLRSGLLSMEEKEVVEAVAKRNLLLNTGHVVILMPPLGDTRSRL